jgi:hypothetical protein
MFPLGSVLAPGGVLPLHVFEPRYRALMADCLDGDGRFGVVLIERGSEVGGGDHRADVGTMATVEQYERFDDGRFAVVAVGRDRFRVAEWLDDAPYPRAVVDAWHDLPLDPGDEVLLTEAAHAVERFRPAGDPLPERSPEPSLASHQLTALAPLGPYDHYRLLCEPGPAARLRELMNLLDDRPDGDALT